MARRVLVFPGGMPRSLAFLDQALQDGREVVGCSSLPYDPVKTRYPSWCYLPFVTDETFDNALAKVIHDYGIDEVFSPNVVVWNYLSRILPEVCPGVALANSSPLDKELLPYQKALDFAQNLNSQPLDLGHASSIKPLMEDVRLASLFHHAELIPGMCDHEKIKALYAIFRNSVPGDVVEIGSWWGKSAFVLSALSKSYEVGKVLCVDPWSNDHLAQGGAKNLIDSIAVDAAGALKIFQLNLLFLAEDVVNYLRLPSDQAARVYRDRMTVQTASFGKTAYEGKISVLHIDGNHTLESVQTDVDAWADLVIPGGWIIFDDYLWPYGDGPKRVGDQYIEDHAESIDLSFVMGSALFVRIMPATQRSIEKALFEP